METKPTHEQAQLHLQVYDLRREARLRQARDWFSKNYNPDTFEDAMRIAAPGTEEGAFVGMVLGYWEQACAFLNYGLLHEDLFFETSGASFSGFGSRSKASFRRLASLSPATSSSHTWNGPRSAMNPGRKAARPAMFLPCGNSCSRRAFNQ